MKKTTKKIGKTTIKICAFILVVNLPFITATQLIGVDAFLDSFDNPNSYLYLKGSGNSMEPNIKDGEYLILQKSSHPDFLIDEGDIVLYFKYSGRAACQRVYHITSIGTVNKYHIQGDNNDFADKPIYENQIVGKVVSTIDNNAWNMISMKLWDLAINNLNVKELV